MTLPVILVHGGAHGAWCWAPMVEYLEAEVIAVDLPPKVIRGGTGRFVDLPELRTLTVGDFAESVLADADAAGFDRFVLVGHSMAGITIPEVARRAPARVAHLVFLSCTVPPEGGSVLGMLDPELLEMTRAAHAERLASPVGEGETRTTLPDGVLRQMFGTDLDDDALTLVLDQMGNEVMQVMDEPVTRVGIPASIPKTWIRLARDAAVSVEQQAQGIANLEAVPGGSVQVIDLDTGHNAMLSRPRELAQIVDRIVAEAS